VGSTSPFRAGVGKIQIQIWKEKSSPVDDTYDGGTSDEAFDPAQGSSFAVGNTLRWIDVPSVSPVYTSSPATINWVYPVNEAAFPSGESYRLRVHAIDVLSNNESTPTLVGTNFVRFSKDTLPPASVVQYPAEGQSYINPA